MNSNIRKDVARLEEEVVKLFIIIITSVECSTSILNHQCPTGDVLAPEMMVASLLGEHQHAAPRGRPHLEDVGQTLDERQLVPPDGVGGENTGSCRPRPVC